MLNELVFLGCHSQFASYQYVFASYSYSCKILQPNVAATARMHSDAFFCLCRCFSNETSKISAPQQIVVLYKQLSVRTDQMDTCESVLSTIKHNQKINGSYKTCMKIDNFETFQLAVLNR